MKLVLHPGHSKCGSTTIQKAIIKNRDLLESNGYVIPDPQMRTKGDRDFNPNGETPRPFFRNVMEKKDLQILKEKLEKIGEKFYGSDVKVLISAENLVNQLGSSFGVKLHQVLYSFFDEHKIIYYIRRQDKFIMSAWQQWGYKRGMLLDAFLQHALKMRNPNYRVISDAFSRLYGKENVFVTPLESRALYKKNLLDDFFKKLDVELGVEHGVDSIDNKSLNPYVCEALSYYSDIFRDIHDESVKEKLVKLSDGHPGLFFRCDDYFSYELREKVLKAFENDNAYIEKTYFSGLGWSVEELEKGGKGGGGALESASSQALMALTSALSSTLK